MKQIILTTLTILAFSIISQAQYAGQTINSSSSSSSSSSFDSKAITKDKVHQILFAEIANQNEYKEKEAAPGSAAVAIGLGLAGGGILLFANGKKRNNAAKSTLFNIDGWGAMGLGTVLVPVGAVIAIVGFSLNSNDKNTTSSNQNSWDSSQTLSDGKTNDSELGLGLTPNGLGLVMSF